MSTGIPLLDLIGASLQHGFNNQTQIDTGGNYIAPNQPQQLHGGVKEVWSDGKGGQSMSFYPKQQQDQSLSDVSSLQNPYQNLSNVIAQQLMGGGQTGGSGVGGDFNGNITSLGNQPVNIPANVPLDTRANDVAQNNPNTNPNAEIGTPNKSSQKNINSNLGIKLMMMGTALQGGNPMDVLSSLVEQQKVQQEMAGGVPLQKGQKEQLQMQIGAQKFGIQREALASEIQGHNDKLKSLTDELTAVQKLPINVRWGKENAILSNIDIENRNLNRTLKRLRGMTGGNQQSVPQGATQYSPSQNKYYDAQGNEVK